MRRSIKRQLATAFAQMALFPLLLLASIGVLWSLISLHKQATDSLQFGADRVAALLDAHLATHRLALQGLGDSLAPSAAAGDALAMDRWLDRYNDRYPGVMTLLIADGRGHVVSASPSQRLRPRLDPEFNVSDRDYFRVALSRGGGYISDAFQGRGFGADPIVALSTRLDNPNGTPVGVLQASLNLNVIAHLNRQLQGLLDAEMLVVDARGKIVASSNAESYPFLSEAPDDWSISEQCRLLEIRSCLTREAALEETGWRVMVRQSPKAAFRAVSPLMASIAVALLVASGLAWFWYRALVRGTAEPLERLADGVSARMSGESVDRIDPSPKAPTEVALLASAFSDLLPGSSNRDRRGEED